MKNFIICLMAFICLPAFVSAQGIKGKVVDENGLPLPGVSVSLVGTTTGTVSDIDGNFSVNAKAGDQLQFSFVGYTTQTVSAADGMTVNMQVSATELKDVVVQIGYGSASKRDLTGSIVKVSGKDLADKPNTSPLASLQGRVAGLQVVNNGTPGAEPDIRIRGTVSLFSTKPLYVVDGIWADNMSFVNPNDIDSIEVLKDPSSCAIFGARGANGVIIVTTKRGSMDKTTISYSTSLGIKRIPNRPDLTDGNEFKMLYDQQRANQGLTPYPYYDLFNANTNWMAEIEANDPTIKIHNLSISNATSNNRIYFGVGFVEEDGLIKNEHYKKFTFNINDELKINDRIKVGANISGYDSRLPQMHDFGAAINATPIVEAFNETEGVYNQLPSDIGGPQIGNPLADVNVVRNGTQLNRDTRFVMSGFAEVKVIDNLKVRANYQANLGFGSGRGYTPVFDVWSGESASLTPFSGTIVSSVNQFKNDTSNIQQELIVSYDKTFGKHDFKSTFVYTRYENRFSSMNGSVRANTDIGQIPNDPRFWYIDVEPYGDITTRVANSDEYGYTQAGYLGRILYNYDGKYLLNASFRRDGSSAVRDWNSGWAVGIGWEVSRESFMANSKINYLKLKASAGELGNQITQIYYPTYPRYVSGSGGSAVFGDEVAVGFSPEFVNNPNLKWETVATKEIGIELATFNNRLSAEVNYYEKKTSDLLAYVQEESTNYYTNAGEIKNSGFEFIGSWKDKIGEVQYGLSANVTTIKNEVLSLVRPNYTIVDGASWTQAGAPIGGFYGYVVEGVYQSYADILASPPSALGSYDVGDLKFKDLNGDGVVNDQDRKVIGNPTPDVTYGFSANISYKGFDLSADFQGVYGNEVYRDWGNGSTFAQFNYRSARLDAWTGPGTSNWEPRLNDATGYNRLPSTYMIEDGSYLRLRNIQVGYNFNPDYLKRSFIQTLRLYLNAQNPITWSNNSGFTPEAGGSPTRFGVDTGGYPIPAIYSIGLSATF